MIYVLTTMHVVQISLYKYCNCSTLFSALNHGVELTSLKMWAPRCMTTDVNLFVSKAYVNNKGFLAKP